MYRLIIVDDEWEALKGMRDTLPWEQWGFEVAGAASSGEEAWSLVETIIPDVLLTDIRMDEMSGIQLIDRVHQKYPEIRSQPGSPLSGLSCTMPKGTCAPG